MRLRLLAKIIVLLFAVFSAAGELQTIYGQTVVAGTGAENISADNAANPPGSGAWTTINGIRITETASGQLPNGGVIRLRAPSGFRLDPAGAAPVVTVRAAPGAQNLPGSFTVTVIERTQTEVAFQINGTTAGTPPNRRAQIDIDNIRTRPVNGTPLLSGELRNVGSAAPGGSTNYATISMVEGEEREILVETSDDGNGQLVAEQNITAGNSLTVYAILRDQFGNFIENGESQWQLINASGLDQNNLTIAGDGKSAIISSTSLGSAQIEASMPAGTPVPTPVPSGTITIVAAPPQYMVLTTQPSETATAGQAFSTQPVIQIFDEFDNLTTNNNATLVTATAVNGSAGLQGTTTLTASSGVVTFSNLAYNIAETISLNFNGNNLTSIGSNDITISPAAAAKLLFTFTPSAANRQAPVDPPVKVQIADTFNNFVSQSGTDITLTKNSGSGNVSGTLTVATDTNGEALFDNVIFSSNGDKTLQAASTGLTSAISNIITVVQAGEVSNFRIDDENGDPIGNQVAGVPFDITITAIDGAGDTVTGFDGTADLSSTSDFITGEGTTPNFTNGVLENYTVNLSVSGDHTITATRTSSTISGSSDLFTIAPNDFDLDNSLIETDPDSIVANGSSTSVLTVVLRDVYGNQQLSGGETVVISTTAGTLLDSVTDNNDGTYTRELQSPVNTGTATISATVNGDSITSGDPTVTFIPGALSTFTFTLAGTTDPISTQTAGVPFEVDIRATDSNNNTITNFDGSGKTAVISSTGILLQGKGTTPEFTNGVLSNYTVEFENTGQFSLTARRTGFSEQGTSNLFDVEPGPVSTATSTITATRNFLQSNGTDNTTITLQLKDALGNNLTTGISEPVTLSSSGNATLSAITNENNGRYTATLQATTTNETVTITGTIDGQAVTDQETVTITQFNIWESSSGGSQAAKQEWDRGGNWSLGTVPTAGQVVIIPTVPANDNLFPQLSGGNVELSFFEIEEGASASFLEATTITILDELLGDGNIIIDNSTANINGNLTISTFTAGTSTVNFTGSSPQTVTSVVTTNNINIQNNISTTNYLESFSNLTIDENFTLTMGEGSELVTFGDIIINGALVGNNSRFTFGGDIVGNNISLTNTSVTFNGDNPQNIDGISNIKSFTINNPTTVSVKNDLVISDTLRITNGQLLVESGNNLVTNVTTGNTASIRMLRDIDGTPGWRLITSPLNSTIGNWLDGTVTQGFDGASLAGDLQPNVLWYQESAQGTDNQRWRAPTGASQNINAGRGYFVYFFGDVAEDNRYNDPLPVTLDVNGAEFNGNGTEVILPVTYTAEADTGWNIVGNPFAATIDWDDGTWQKTNMDNSIYVWDEETNQYLYWNGAAGSLGNGKIAPFQAFWVKANGNGAPDLRVRKSSKTTGGVFRKDQSRYEDIPVLSFKLESDFYSTSTHFTFTENGSFNTDAMDAYRLLPFETNTYLEVFSLFSDGTELAINNLPRDFGKIIEIPVQVGAVKEGSPYSGLVTLTWPEFENIPDSWTIELYDHYTKETINLKNSSFYDFDIRARSKGVAEANTMSNFRLLEKSKFNSANSRFTLLIEPGNDGSEFPTEVMLNQNYPNPFNPSTTINFGLPTEDRVRIDVYDLLGRRVHTITDQRYQAGYHQVEFDGRSLASGVYFYRLRTSAKVLDKRMTLIK